jgi:alpha-glucosidase
MVTAPWWQGAVVYQVYVRSFADSNGDGQGDFAGLAGKLDYIKALGVDAIWLSPIHPSPNRDWGYDVSDYEDVHPDYGTLADFDRLVAEAHARGIKVVLDEVLCHTSDEHPWFRDSMQRGEKSDWYVWADPKEDGTAPNNWLSAFGGPAWSYHPARRQHFHHKFLRQQPKLNWQHPKAREAGLKVLDFWLNRGVDGYRLDVANAYLHDTLLRDNPPVPAQMRTDATWADADNLQEHLFDCNLPENVLVLEQIRRRVEAHNGPEGDRFVFGEFSEGYERAGAYAAPDEGLHGGYTFFMLRQKLLSPGFITGNYALLSGHPRHWPVVAFCNHDISRTVSRFGGKPEGDPALAKLMLALLFAIKGTVCLYQGEELGLTDVDLRRDQLRDPVGDLYYPVAKGRDACRTPMPWDAAAANYGFSPGTPWLPVGPAHKALAVSEQEKDPNSTLAYARKFLAARKAEPALVTGEMKFIPAPLPVLAFARTLGKERLVGIFNLSRQPVAFDLGPLGAVTPLDLACGDTAVRGNTLDLGPLACWFGRG